MEQYYFNWKTTTTKNTNDNDITWEKIAIVSSLVTQIM
jgi:hypothetical protein